MKTLVRLLVALISIVLSTSAHAELEIKPAVVTEAVRYDADDPAIWINRDDPEKSLILGTDKGKGETTGSLYVFGLDGKIRQRIQGLKKPNNVDVEYGFKLGDRLVDIAVVTEANAKRLRIYEISSAGKLIDISGRQTEVFVGEPSDHRTPMGIGLYKRQSDGMIYAIVSRGSGPKEGYLGQYLLKSNGSGKVDAIEVRKFGRFSGVDCIEAVAVDDELGHVYYADESRCIRKYRADPDHALAGEELGLFGVSEFTADREGIAVYTLPNGEGYIVCTDQVKNSRFLIYPREGYRTKPHDHGRAIKVVLGGAADTDGIEVVSDYLGNRFPNGVLVAMNSPGRNFMVFDWRTIAETGEPVLKLNKKK